MTKINFTEAALSNIHETGCDPQEDIEALRRGIYTRESLLAHCLDGVELDDAQRIRDWNEYVDALMAAL